MDRNVNIMTVFEQQTSQKVRKKVFNWSEVHLYQSNLLKNPYFNNVLIFEENQKVTPLLKVYAQ
jgi:hypothetical protein